MRAHTNERPPYSQTVWQGIAEMSTLTGHITAKKAFAWSHQPWKGDKSEPFAAVLEISSIESPQAAVKVALIAEVNRRR